MIDDFLIEYFVNPPQQLKKYNEEDFKNFCRTDVRMYATGKILFDKTGTMKKLQDEAKNLLKKEFKKQAKSVIEMNKYELWDELNNLKDLQEEKSQHFDYVYFLLLDNTLQVYKKFLKAETSAPSKLLKFLTDKDFSKRYKIAEFPDKKFVEKFVKCINKKNFQNIESLINYTLEAMEGFNINGWRLKSRISV